LHDFVAIFNDNNRMITHRSVMLLFSELCFIVASIGGKSLLQQQ